MTPRLIWTAVAGVAMLLAVVLIVAVAERPKQEGTSGGGQTQLTRAQVQARLQGSPPALAALHARGGMLLEGNAKAWQTQLKALRGWPLVVNKWASWCVPCRAERVVFQRAAAQWGRRVAFVGVDSGDTSRKDALAFLRAAPESYPSYYDESGSLGRAITDSSFTPVTVFVKADGARYVHQGPYASVEALERDIERYAVGA